MVIPPLRAKYSRLSKDEHGETQVLEYDRSVTSHVVGGNWHLILLAMALATVVVVQSALLALATKYSIACRKDQGNFSTCTGYSCFHAMTADARSAVPKKFVTFVQGDDTQRSHTAGNIQEDWERFDRRTWSISAWCDVSLTLEAYNGFVHLDEPWKLGLKPNKNVIPGTHNMYMTTLYHQFHCLRELQQALMGSTHRTVDRHHAEHCFSYLRQAAMCAGDMTLEPPDEVPEPGRSPLRGWNVTHECIDFDHVMNWMQQHEPKF